MVDYNLPYGLQKAYEYSIRYGHTLYIFLHVQQCNESMSQMNIRLAVPYKENTLHITILFQYITQILQVVVNRLMTFAIDTVFMRCIKIRMRQQVRGTTYILPSLMLL